MNGAYKVYLPTLLASDAGLPISGFLDWSFATVNTAAPFDVLVVGIAFLTISLITYAIAAATTPRLMPQMPLYRPRFGYLASIVALVTLIISSAKITADMRRVADKGAGTTHWGFLCLYLVGDGTHVSRCYRGDSVRFQDCEAGQAASNKGLIVEDRRAAELVIVRGLSPTYA